jgi:hypothetical protein
MDETGILCRMPVHLLTVLAWGNNNRLRRNSCGVFSAIDSFVAR